jgi:hypothetical protein
MSSETRPSSSPLAQTPWEPHTEPAHRLSMRHAFDDGEDEVHTGPLVAIDLNATTQEPTGSGSVAG